MIPHYPTGYACSLIGPPGKHVRFHVDKVEERNQPHDKPGAEDRNRTFHRLPLSRALYCRLAAAPLWPAHIKLSPEAPQLKKKAPVPEFMRSSEG